MRNHHSHNDGRGYRLARHVSEVSCEIGERADNTEPRGWHRSHDHTAVGHIPQAHRQAITKHDDHHDPHGRFAVHKRERYSRCDKHDESENQEWALAKFIRQTPAGLSRDAHAERCKEQDQSGGALGQSAETDQENRQEKPSRRRPHKAQDACRDPQAEHEVAEHSEFEHRRF